MTKSNLGEDRGSSISRRCYSLHLWLTKYRLTYCIYVQLQAQQISRTSLGMSARAKNAGNTRNPGLKPGMKMTHFGTSARRVPLMIVFFNKYTQELETVSAEPHSNDHFGVAVVKRLLFLFLFLLLLFFWGGGGKAHFFSKKCFF